MTIATVIVFFLYGACFCAGIGKKQNIRHVFAPFAGKIDLRQVVLFPTQRDQRFFDNELLGLRFVKRGFRREIFVNALQRGVETGESVITQGFPGRRFADAAQQKILGKELSLHGCPRSAVFLPGNVARHYKS